MTEKTHGNPFKLEFFRYHCSRKDVCSKKVMVIHSSSSFFDIMVIEWMFDRRNHETAFKLEFLRAFAPASGTPLRPGSFRRKNSCRRRPKGPPSARRPKPIKSSMEVVFWRHFWRLDFFKIFAGSRQGRILRVFWPKCEHSAEFTKKLDVFSQSIEKTRSNNRGLTRFFEKTRWGSTRPPNKLNRKVGGNRFR